MNYRALMSAHSSDETLLQAYECRQCQFSHEAPDASVMTNGFKADVEDATPPATPQLSKKSMRESPRLRSASVPRIHSPLSGDMTDSDECSENDLNCEEERIRAGGLDTDEEENVIVTEDDDASSCTTTVSSESSSSSGQGVSRGKSPRLRSQSVSVQQPAKI